MLKREILLTGCAIVLALSGQEAKAAEACTATPTCAALGYTQTDCKGALSLKCPFDSTKLFCGSTCPSGYVYGEITGKCGERNPDLLMTSSDQNVYGVAISPKVMVAMEDQGMYKWDNAVTQCNSKKTLGRKWRLPTQYELEQMSYLYTKMSELFAAHGGTKMSLSYRYWSKDVYSGLKAFYGDINGRITYYEDKSTIYMVRCVTDM